MKYPKQWTAVNPYASWGKTDQGEEFTVRCRISRPNKVDNDRPVVIRMNREEAIALRNQLSRIIGLA